MRQYERVGQRFFALAMTAAVGLSGTWPPRVMSQQPPAGKPASPSGSPPRGRAGGAQSDEAVRRAQARQVELPKETIVRGKAATALVEVRSMGSGTAVCVSVDGFFVTNHHVVADAGIGHEVRLIVRSAQNDQRVERAQIIRLDEENDLALLKVKSPVDLMAIPLGSDDDLVETTPLAAFGYPFGRMLAADGRYPAVSVNTGSVTALRRKAGKLSSIQLDASVNPGNSGGPVIDRQGNLIGIIQSGVPGAMLNFAIPVSVVREFLSGPVLVLRDPGITFPDRSKQRSFEIDSYSLDRRGLDEISVELSFTEAGGQPQMLAAKRRGDQFVAEGSACLPTPAPAKPILIVHKGRGHRKVNLPSGDLLLGNRRFAWQTIDSLVKDGNVWIVSLLDGKRFATQKVQLPSASFAPGRTTQLATADRIEVRLETVPATEVTYEIQARRGPTEFSPIHGRLRINRTPEGMSPAFDQPIDRARLGEPIVVEGIVRESLILGVAPNGVVWGPTNGLPSGFVDVLHGLYLLVNGQRWYATAVPAHIPILLGMRDCQIQLMWSRPAAGGPHNPDRVSVEVQKVNEVNLTSMIVKNRAAEPSHVALAITFNSPQTSEPILPPRSEPVLESHWPLNDDDPAVATDIGPAKRTGHSSDAHIVPGARGNGLQIEHQTILCPGVLPVDRSDTFSCTAWMKPARAENLTLFGRMNSGLRGFDLNYGGSLQAHLISNWDSSAISVVSIERFDSSVWHHVGVTYDGSNRSQGWKIYLDGAVTTPQISVDRLNDTIRCDYPFAMGGRERRDRYQGRMDEVRAYNRVLAEDEIFELYDLERSNLDPANGSSLKKGLVGHWSFDGPPSEAFRDKSGLGHDGRVEPDLGVPEIVDGDGSKALRLDGQGSVDCGRIANFDREDSYSLGAWFKPRGDGLRTVMAAFDVFYRGFDLAFDGHVVCHLISEWDGNAIKVSTQSTYPNDAWHHVVCTYDGSSRSTGFKVYVDGADAALDANCDSLTAAAKTRASLRIGSRIAQHYFVGELDDAFVYGRALGPDEARAWFMRGRAPAGELPADLARGLIGLWTFEGNGPEAFHDKSGHGHHGEPDVHFGHSAIVSYGTGRAARFRNAGGFDCGNAGDFERDEAFSVGGWFCYEGNGTHSVFSKIQPNGVNRGYEVQYDGENYLALLAHNWNENNALAVKTAPIRGTGWRHVFLTYDGKSRASGLKLYIDGQSQNVTVQKDNLSKSIRFDEPFIIGSRSTGLSMRGLASHVRLIPRELTAEQVRHLMTTDRPPGALP
jgi:S1-C subfamily serine protease